MITVLHIPTFRIELLRRTHGNIAQTSALNDMGELPSHRSIRESLNQVIFDPRVTEEHDLSVPFTGALTELFMRKYFAALRDSGIDNALCDLAISRMFAIGGHPAFPDLDSHLETFQAALVTARDFLGMTLVRLWHALMRRGLRGFSYSLCVMLLAQNETHPASRETLLGCFTRRHINPAPPPSIHRAIHQRRPNQHSSSLQHP
jgi:hypothetical protein